MNLLTKTINRIKNIFSTSSQELQTKESNEELQNCIHYHFKNPSYLKHALVHKSFVSQNDKKGLFSNERLEFLGDAVLNCLVTEHIYKLYPDYSEGQLSKIKSLLVSRKIIGEVAKFINLGCYLHMGQSEKRSSGQNRTSIISNAFEALLGAVYLDGGLKAACKVLEKLLYNRIDEFINDKCNINYKSKILEMSQADGFGIPNYPLLAEEGPDHAKEFIVGIDIAGVRLAEGSGPNKKNAQQDAAQKSLKKYSKEYILSNKGAR
jgi:ribonuclease-3